jgi:hypothetical protein
MSKYQRNTCATSFHSIVAALLLFSGAALLVYGVYRRIEKDDEPFHLKYEAADVKELDNVASAVLHFNLVLILVGAFLLLSGVAALVAMSRKCAGRLFRIIFFLMAALIAAALVGTSVASLYLRSRRDSGPLFEYVGKAWEATVSSNAEDVCALEAKHQCRGFADGDCTTCPTGVGAGCTAKAKLRCAPCTVGTSQHTGRGCWQKFLSRAGKFFLATGAASAALAVVCLVDICLLWTL